DGIRDDLVTGVQTCALPIFFPLKGADHLRLIGPVSWEPNHEHRELTYDDVGERAIKNMKLTVARVNWFSTYHVHHRVAARFRVEIGRAACREGRTRRGGAGR